MLDKHKKEKRQAEFKKQLEQIIKLQEQQKLAKAAARTEHMKAIISGDIQHNSELLTSAKDGVIMTE